MSTVHRKITNKSDEFDKQLKIQRCIRTLSCLEIKLYDKEFLSDRKEAMSGNQKHILDIIKQNLFSPIRKLSYIRYQSVTDYSFV